MQLKIENLNYIYSKDTAYEKQALKDVNIQIEKGEFIGLIGHTGSGKSTLIQHLNGLIKATSGAIYYNGENIYDEKYDMRNLRSEVGLVFQYPEHQLFETTVLKDVCYGPTNLNLTQEEVMKRSQDALRAVGFPEKQFEDSPFDLSGGQKRRVAIAGVLAMQPQVLILDEPTAGLDPKGRNEILEQISLLHRENDITVIIVSHSMEDMAKYVERLIVMNHGQVAYDGEPRKVFQHYRELEKIGLGAPQVTYVMNELKMKGMDVDDKATTIDEAKESILKSLHSYIRK